MRSLRRISTSHGIQIEELRIKMYELYLLGFLWSSCG